MRWAVFSAYMAWLAYQLVVFVLGTVSAARRWIFQWLIYMAPAVCFVLLSLRYGLNSVLNNRFDSRSEEDSEVKEADNAFHYHPSRSFTSPVLRCCWFCITALATKTIFYSAIYLALFKKRRGH